MRSLLRRVRGYVRIRVVKHRLTHIIPAALAVLLVAFTGVYFLFAGHAETPTSVPGESYQLCPAYNTGGTQQYTSQSTQYLTSQWTYDALSSGMQTYTVQQYEALTGYNTTLPPLPSYISSESSNTIAAIIFAPGATGNQQPNNMPGTALPLLYFFEGGSYGELNQPAVSGDEFIGGAATVSGTYYPEPEFNDAASGSDGINASNSTYDTSYNTGNASIGSLTAAASQGSTTLTIGATTIPLVQWGVIRIDSHDYTISSLTGSESSGYTVTIRGGMDIAEANSTLIYYDGLAGNVTVEYLNVLNDQHSTTGTLYTGSGWTIEHNDIHDGYSNGAGNGVAIYGGDEGTIEYNCLSRMGANGIDGIGTSDWSSANGDDGTSAIDQNSTFEYNEVYESNYQPDPGCGCSAAGKWWGTLNANIVDNAFVEDGQDGQPGIWLDNGNSGTLIQGNYFFMTGGQAISDETGFDADITGNLFQDDNWGTGSGCGDSNCAGDVSMNSSGGWNVPNSNYENEMLITNNQFVNDWGGVGIWQSGQRSCQNSGEGWPMDSGYCAGGFPNTATTAGNTATAGVQFDFSHAEDNEHGGSSTNVVQSASAGSTTLLVNSYDDASAEAIHDQIGFTSYPESSVSTSTSDTTNVSTFTGSGTINATTTGFPSSGQLIVDTSDGQGAAVLNYTSTTASSFRGVSLVYGSGTLVDYG
ncbi:MAG TPA: hypothetical protein VMB52_04650, partial [Verrucomicrobiae bacterium]|nr:hypothetical protein [Verrucomicrobiae bacterium]